MCLSAKNRSASTKHKICHHVNGNLHLKMTINQAKTGRFVCPGFHSFRYSRVRRVLKSDKIVWRALFYYKFKYLVISRVVRIVGQWKKAANPPCGGLTAFVMVITRTRGHRATRPYLHILYTMQCLVILSIVSCTFNAIGPYNPLSD